MGQWRIQRQGQRAEVNLEGRRNSGGHRRGENKSILRESKSIETREKEKRDSLEGMMGRVAQVARAGRRSEGGSCERANGANVASIDPREDSGANEEEGRQVEGWEEGTGGRGGRMEREKEKEAKSDLGDFSITAMAVSLI